MIGEKMDEQKRLLLAVVLSVVVLVGYQTFFVKPPLPNSQTKSNQAQDSQSQQDQNQQTQQVNQEPSNISDYKAPLVQPEPVEKPESQFRTISVSTPLYNIAISEYGAAVRRFELKNYKQTNKQDSPFKQLVSKDLVSGTLSLDLERESVPGLKNAVYTAGIGTDKLLSFKAAKVLNSY